MFFLVTSRQRDLTYVSFQLLAPGLEQRGNDDEGILGFLVDDIMKESRRVAFLRCFFCRKSHANLGCCLSNCKKAFHIECGRNNNASFEFVDKFPSYCQEHSKNQNVKTKKKKSADCGICMDKIRSARAVLIPCCKNAWFHTTCLQRFATTSGVFFKCPLCNDTKVCKKELPLQGIFLPEKDADWNYDLSNFENLNETIEEMCDAEENCQSEANFLDLPEQWKLCSTCGASAIHLKCWDQVREFVCKSCDEILNRPKENEESSATGIENRRKNQNQPNELKENTVNRHTESTSNYSEEVDAIVKPPMKKKAKFNSWFSDDDQFPGSSDEETSEIFRPEPTRKLRSHSLLSNSPLSS